MFASKIVEFNIPVVMSHDPVSDPESFINHIREIEGSEGVIVAWNNGHRVKCKGDWYCFRHSAKDSIIRENGVISLILEEKIDDIKPVLSEEDRQRLDKFESDFWQGVKVTMSKWSDINYFTRAQFGNDRKAFAMSDSGKNMDGNIRAAIFKAWDSANFDWRGAVVDTVRKNLGSQPKVDSVRTLFGDAKWSYGANMGDDE